MISECNEAQISRIELRRMIEFLPYPILVWEMDGNNGTDLFFFNAKFVSQIGYSFQDASTGDEMLKRLYPYGPYRKQVLGEWRRQRETIKMGGAEYIKFKVHLTCGTGDKRWFEMKVSIIGDLYLAAYVDIDTDVIKHERQMKINADNDILISILGHDLRSPVANLNSISAMALNGYVSQEEFMSMIPYICQESMQVLELLDNAFNWARLNFNSISVRRAPIDFNALIKSVLKGAKLSYESKGITVSVAVGQLNHIENDFEILNVILRNIVSNAVKFTPKNGLITITLDGAKLIIADNGVGMSPEKLEEIKSENHFSTRGTENEKGNGIGLKLVACLIEKINCGLLIESGMQKGTSVSVIFKD